MSSGGRRPPRSRSRRGAPRPAAARAVPKGPPAPGTATRPATRIPAGGLALGLALAAFLVFNANGREAYPTGDSRPTALLPFSILWERDLDLDEYHPPDAEVSGPIRREGGHIRSNYSPLPALLSLPVYLLAWPHRAEIEGDMLRWTPFFSKLAGSLFAALAVACFFLAAAQVASQRAAAVTALVLAFGSPFWVSASQTLGQHALTVALGSLALLALVRLERTGSARWSLLAGLFCAMAVGIRLSNLVVFGTFLGYLLLYHRRHAPIFAAPALVIGTPFALHLLAIQGGTGGGLEAFAFVSRVKSALTSPLGAGLPGLLVSPGEGLFVWSPVLLMLLLPLAGLLAAKGQEVARAGAARARGRRAARRSVVGGASPPASGQPDLPAHPAAAGRWPRRRFLVLCLVTFVLLLVLYSKYAAWWGGRTYGPRYMTDTLPFLLLPAAAGLERWLDRRAFWVALVTLLLWSSYVQALGAFRYPCRGSGAPDRVRRDEYRVWDWGESDISLCSESLRRPPQDFETARRLMRMTWREIAG
jgi:hypothetical protein